MKCQDAEQLILLKDSNELAEHRVHSLTAHLHDCESCQRFQHALIEVQDVFQTQEEPSAKTMQQVLREARENAPEQKTIPLFRWKPALAMAASAAVVLGFFSLTLRSDKVGLEMIITETQLLKTEDQLVDVMYSGLSEDNLAFNFLMTYEGNGS